jgi:hypothetical protein
MDCSVNAPQKANNVNAIWVWLDETVALKQGQGVCYHWDYGTAVGVDYRRTNRVELPTILNAPYFAGVAARNYAACSTGQLIEVYIPGSTCPILTKANSTIGVGRLTCQAGGTYAGYFTAEGFAGKGSAIVLQTVDTSSTVGLCEAFLEEGPQSGLQEILTCTAGGATTIMVGGITHFATATLAADATFTIAAGTKLGQKKAFVVDGTQTTNNVVVTFGGTAMQADNSTTLASVTMDTTGSVTVVEWNGYWRLAGNLTSVIA